MKHFAIFHFDDQERSLWRGEQAVSLTGKARALLACLLAAHPHRVTKADIMTSVWPDTHVHPDNIKVLIREIRRALHDDSRRPRFVRSEPGGGYAFIADLSEGPAHSPAPGAELPHFMNRNREMAELAESLDSARAGSKRLMLITGERGIGKTALCEVFLRLASAATALRAVSVSCAEGPVPSEPFFPLLEAFGRLGRQYPAVVPPALADHAPSWFMLFPQWAARRAKGADPATLIQELPGALAALSRDVPLVLVIEDLQSSDEATVRALAALAADADAARWLVIGTWCPYDATPVTAALTDLAATLRRADGSCVVDLDPLSVDQVARYVDARFGADRLTGLATALHDITDGNPSMMVAAADGLVGSGVVQSWGDEWRAELDLATLEGLLPQLLREGVVRQLDRLTTEDRRLLEAASAVGLEFTPAAVALAADMEGDEATRLLSRLAGRGTIIRADAAVAEGPPELFRFRHPMYAELLAERAPIMERIRAAQRVARAGDGVVLHRPARDTTAAARS